MILVEEKVAAGAAPAALPAFAVLYERHYGLVYAFIQRRIVDPVLAEDITAQTFTQAWHAFARYEERGVPVAAWLLRIAQHEVISHTRRRWPLPLRPEALEGVGGAAALPEERVVQWERAAWLRSQLRGLPAAQRQAVWLRFGEERSFREIATRLGRSEGAARVLLHRALKTLRLQMQAHVAE
jgi:RNA polymerase sigma-70 factor (ECF subfamily)